MQFQTTDTKIYNHILLRQKIQTFEIKPIRTATAFLTHIIFKAIILLIWECQPIFVKLTSSQTVNYVVLIFIVVDFWFTKNINARKLIGLRWFYGDNERGQEKFMYEVRINDEYTSPVNSKLFWVVMGVYIIVPLIDLSTTIIISTGYYRLDYMGILINLSMLTGGVSNLFLFYKAYASASKKIAHFRRLYGTEFCRKLGPSSIISTL